MMKEKEEKPFGAFTSVFLFGGLCNSPFFYFSGSSAHRGRRCSARTMLLFSSKVPSPSQTVAYHMGLCSFWVSGSTSRFRWLAYWKCRWLSRPPVWRAVRGGMGSMANRQRKGQSAATFSAMKSAFSLLPDLFPTRFPDDTLPCPDLRHLRPATRCKVSHLPPE